MPKTSKHPVEAAQAALEQGSEKMWRNVMADAVLVLFETDGVVTREALKVALEKSEADQSQTIYRRATFRGALNALDGRPPRD